jgi:hypothetical protein
MRTLRCLAMLVNAISAESFSRNFVLGVGFIFASMGTLHLLRSDIELSPAATAGEWAFVIIGVVLALPSVAAIIRLMRARLRPVGSRGGRPVSSNSTHGL